MLFKKKPPKHNTAVAQGPSRGRIDIPFLILVLLLLGIGLVVLASASYVASYYENDGNSYAYISKQLIFAAIGLVAMAVASNIDYHKYKKYAAILYIVSIVLLVLVLFIGKKVDGARRWIHIGFSFQPSEIAKFAIILRFASYISANYKHMDKFKVGIWPLLWRLAIIVVLVAIEPHLSGAILLLAVGVIMMFIGGAALRWFFLAIGAGGVGLTVLVIANDYMQRRLLTWLNPFLDPLGDGYHTVQSLYAIGSGGLLGLGLGQSRQKHLYLPKPYNDYIFSVACEELGFIGALLIILLFVMLIWRGFYIAFNARDKFGAMIVIGITSHVAVQALFNIGVVTGVLPPTGISLPFFSSGGTAIIVLLAEMGVVLGVSRYCYLDKR